MLFRSQVNPVVALSIAGSDSGGGAGIQADLHTMANCGVFGTTVVTAVTAQNTVGVSAVGLESVGLIRAQIDAVVSDFSVAAAKTGMLGSPDIINEVATVAAAGRLPNLVVDPVLVSTTGAALMTGDGPRTYVDRLLPRALLATPNLREAAVLLGHDAAPVDDATQIAWARELSERAQVNVLLKGGHRSGDTCLDVLVTSDGVTEFRSPRVDTLNDHGTGCSLSAAISAYLARGDELVEAVERARAYVHRALVGGAHWSLGRGRGPLDHSPATHTENP